MAQRIKSEKKRSPIARAASSLKKTVIKAKEKLTSHRGSEAKAAPAKTAAPRIKKPAAAKTAEHPRRIVTDVPMDQLSAAYTPRQTSLKTPFRADGSDRQRDQELTAGVGDERWRDEDRLTNRSGDPRIGTHGRTYDGQRRISLSHLDLETE